MSYANETGFSKIFSKVKTYVNSKISSAHTNILKDVYPVGSIYMSVNNASPSTLFGGTWERIQGRFLLGVGENEVNTSTTQGNLSPGAVNVDSPEANGGTNSHNHSQSSTTGDTTLSTSQIPKLSGSITMHNQNVYTNVHTVSGIFSAGKSVSRYFGGESGYTGANSVSIINFNAGGGGSHNHSLSSVDNTTTLPPYFSVYMWKRTV